MVYKVYIRSEPNPGGINWWIWWMITFFLRKLEPKLPLSTEWRSIEMTSFVAPCQVDLRWLFPFFLQRPSDLEIRVVRVTWFTRFFQSWSKPVFFVVDYLNISQYISVLISQSDVSEPWWTCKIVGIVMPRVLPISTFWSQVKGEAPMVWKQRQPRLARCYSKRWRQSDIQK